MANDIQIRRYSPSLTIDSELSGHTLTIEVDEDKEMSFGGMNG